VYAEQLVSVC